MPTELKFTTRAKADLSDLEKDKGKYKKVKACLGKLQGDPRHPGLKSHKYTVMKGHNNEDMWQSYVENNTPAAWRVFWHYGPEPDTITIFAITPHP